MDEKASFDIFDKFWCQLGLSHWFRPERSRGLRPTVAVYCEGSLYSRGHLVTPSRIRNVLRLNDETMIS